MHGPLKLTDKKSYYEADGKPLEKDALEAANSGGIDFPVRVTP